VSRFANVARPAFGRRAAPAEPPALRRSASRRFAMLKDAGDAVRVLPAPGESVHCLMTGRYDLMHVVALLCREPVAAMSVATLSYNARNLAELLRLLDEGAVAKLSLLCSAFFRDHNKELWAETVGDFRERNQRCAAARSHAKVVCLKYASGRTLVMEGSANLRTNGNREQLCLTADDELHDWHRDWIAGLIDRHEGENERAEAE
jgi:hypothetical protein